MTSRLPEALECPTCGIIFAKYKGVRASATPLGRGRVPSMPTFDIVSEVDPQEVTNAVDQTARELVNRYDFRGTNSIVRFADDEIVVESSTDNRLEAAIDVLKEKLVRRKVSLKSLSGGTPKEIGGGRFQSTFALNQGIAQDATDKAQRPTPIGSLRGQRKA